MPIVLADGYDARRRVLAYPFERRARQLLAHLIVGEAELPPARTALAVDLAVPLGVLGEVFIGRQKLKPRMTPAEYLVMAAVFGWNVVEVPVQLELRREQRVLQRISIECLPVAQPGSVGDIEVRHA